MRFLPFLILAALVVVGVKRLLARPAPAEAEEPEPVPTGVTGQLRARILRGTASEFSIEPLGGVWGVLMETGYPEAAATLVALADGSASLYFSSGGGVVGGGPNPAVNLAARRLVELSAEHAPELSITKAFPLPDTGDVRFYVLTTHGVLGSTAHEETLHAGGHPLSDIFFAGHEVIGRLREVSEERVLH